MNGRSLFGCVIAAGIGLTMLAPASALAFDAGGFAGGVLGGLIGNALRPPTYYVARPRYRVVARHAYVTRRSARVAVQPRHVAGRAASSPSAAVNPSADPFAVAKPSGPTPLPVANKP